jgi:hypothetical protein
MVVGHRSKSRRVDTTQKTFFLFQLASQQLQHIFVRHLQASFLNLVCKELAKGPGLVETLAKANVHLTCSHRRTPSFSSRLLSCVAPAGGHVFVKKVSAWTRSMLQVTARHCVGFSQDCFDAGKLGQAVAEAFHPLTSVPNLPQNELFLRLLRDVQ